MKKSLMKQVEIEIPSVPNFIRTKDGHSVIHISEFSEKELKDIATEWAKKIIRKSKDVKIL